MRKKIAIGQAGGPTAVINASLASFIERMEQYSDIYAVYNGYQGLADNSIERLDDDARSWVKANRLVNGACLGSGRFDFTPEKMEKAIRHLKQHNINTLVFIGGNGTMAALSRLSELARQSGYDLQIIGIPKTVDNDLAMTDHAPGFGSAARYTAAAVRDITRDLAAMKNFEQVRILETMGRNAGWLAAAGGLLKASEEEGPHFIYVPERPIEASYFVENVKQAIKCYGYASIVVSEGCTLKNVAQVTKAEVNGRTVLGGISAKLEQIVREELGVMARSELLGMNQRSSSIAVSLQDRVEAEAAGAEAARLVREDETEKMVTIHRSASLDYTFHMNSCLLQDVAEGGERFLPDAFIDNPDAYYTWLKPLAGDDLIPYPPSRKRRLAYEKQ